MLRGLRKASSNWLGKVVMAAVVGFLIISFAIWGIGDIFRGMTRTAVATIGGTEISGEQFRQLYNERLQQFSRQFGRPITPEQARLVGFDQQLLGQLLAETALDERAKTLKLGISDADVAKRIVQDPNFRGLTGQFDQMRFEQMIRQGGFTEQRYVSEQRRVAMRAQIAGTLTNGTTVPGTATDALNRFENEQRAIDYVVLTAATAGDVPAPSPEVIAKYFEDRKVMFRAPEYRKLFLLMVTPDEIAKGVEVSDADAKQLYEARQARYATPERREIQQIVFPNEEEAKKAVEKLAGGTWFEQVGADRGLKLTDINLGLVAKSGLADPAVADAAFALKAGEVSEPIKGKFGVALIRVQRIEPATVKSFTEVEPEIKTEIALERAKAEVAKRRDKIEDELAAGSRLDETAQKLSIPLRTIAAVDRSGRGPDGNLVTDLPAGTDILSNAFSTDVGVENDPVQVNGGFAWYEVAGITPSHDRTLDEVKDKVETSWREDEVAARLKTKADDMVEKLKGGDTLAALAAANKLKVETAKGIKRSGTEAVPSQVVAAVFKAAKDAPGDAEGKDATERFVFRVTDISVPALDKASPEAKRMSDTLRQSIENEMLSQYVARLESDLGTTINQNALAQAIGTASQN